MSQSNEVSARIPEIKKSYANVQELYNLLKDPAVAKIESDYVITKFKELITVMLNQLMTNSTAVKGVNSVDGSGNLAPSYSVVSDDAGDEINDTIDGIIHGISGVINKDFYSDDNRYELKSDELCQLTKLSQSVLDVIGGAMYAPFATGPCSGDSRYTRLNDVLTVTKITYNGAVDKYNVLKENISALNNVAPGAFETLTAHFNSVLAKPYSADLIKNFETAISEVLKYMDSSTVEICNQISEQVGSNLQGAYANLGAQEANNKTAFKDHFKVAFHSAPIMKKLISAIESTSAKVNEFNNAVEFIHAADNEYIAFTDNNVESDAYVTAPIESCFVINNIPLKEIRSV